MGRSTPWYIPVSFALFLSSCTVSLMWPFCRILDQRRVIFFLFSLVCHRKQTWLVYTWSGQGWPLLRGRCTSWCRQVCRTACSPVSTEQASCGRALRWDFGRWSASSPVSFCLETACRACCMQHLAKSVGGREHYRRVGILWGWWEEFWEWLIELWVSWCHGWWWCSYDF